MKVLMISTDRKAFDRESAVAKRFIQYGTLVDELHIIIFSPRSLPLSKLQLSERVWLYPTNSRSGFLYIHDTILLGKGLGMFNLVTAQDPFETGKAAAALARYCKARLEIQIHTDFLSPAFTAHSFLNSLRMLGARYALIRADSIRVVSNRIKESLINRHYKLKTIPVVLPIFVDVEKIRSAPITVDLRKKYPQFTFRFLIASRLERERNIALVLRSFPEVIKRYPQAGLIIVGGGKERPVLEKMVRDLGLSRNVVFEGWQSELASYYKTAEVFLNTPWYEGYGRSLAEAAAIGMPIISTDVGIAREVKATIVTPTFIVPVLRQCLERLPPPSKFNAPYKDEEDYLHRYGELWRSAGAVQ